MTTRWLRLLLLPLVLGPAGAMAQERPQLDLPRVSIGAGMFRIDAQVAASPEQRQIGLMYRFNLPADRGMLFVFPRPEPLSFWMRNTYIPLSIAFIDAEGRILNVEDMAPRDETGVPSRGAALYALEMRKGWFADRGVVAGARVIGLPPASRQ